MNTGQIARVRAGSLSYGTSYHWQYRALDSTARTDGQTGWTEYLTALNTDFTVVNAAPSVTGLQQRIYDGSCDGIETTVGVGGNIDQTTICLEATVNDTNTNPPQTIQLQVEVQPTATTFGCTGTGTCAASPQVVTSGAVNSGTVARITFSALTFNTAYHWQARGLDSIGAASAWTSFGTNFDPFDTDFIPTKFPPTISALQQRVWDGVACNGDETTVRVGGDILQQTICLETKADDLDSATVRVEVEVQPVGTAFSNTATVAIDPLNSGSVGVGTVIQVGPINPLSIPGNLGPGVADSSLLALWHFDEGTGLTAADSGNVPADTGTLTGGTAWTTAGRFNRALSFNGGSNFVIVGNASAINTGTTKTVEAWVKTTSATTQVVFSTYDGGSGYQLYLQSGRPFTWSNAAVVIGGSTLDSGVSVSDGAWHHIAGVWDGTNGYIYVDGTLRNSAARTINNSTRDNQIGAACSGVASTTCSDFFNGFIDEVAIFSAPLTAPQIADHYLRGGAPLAYGTSYHWQARAVDPTGLESGWTSFATNFDPNDPDFNVVNKTPTATLAQQRVDDDGVCNGSTVPGETTVIVGGVVSVGNICFNATLSDANTLPSQTITLEVEVQPTTSTFSCTGTGACNATTVSRGTAVTDGIIGRVRVSGLADGSYHWQYRAKDSTLRDADGYSAWTSFGTDVSGASFSVGNAAPTINPATVQQRKDLGSCPTLAGSTVAEQAGATPAGTIGELSICLNATLSDVNVGDTITLQVEVQPVTSTFGGAVATSGPVSDGGVATIEVGSLSYGTSYHWRYRAVDQLNAASVWTEFGTSGNTDFKVVNALPTIQAGTANQRVYNSIPSPCNGSGAVVPENTSIFQQNICFEASLRDTSTLPSQTITLEVEVKPVSQTFTGTASSTSGLVIDGGIARVSGPSGTPGRGLAPGDLGPGVLNSNLMALWHMNNDWLDSSLNIPVNNGTAVNGATFTIASRLGAAAGSFAAATLDHVVVPDSPTLDGMTNMSVEAWVNLNSLTPTPDPQTIVAKELNYVLAVRPDGLLAGYIGDGGVAFGLSAEVTGGTPLVPGNWYHVAMTYDGTNINLYLNAILDATGTFTGGVGDTVDTVDIGYRPDLPGWPFDGRMDEVAIFNIPLNPDQITDHYTRAFDTGSLSYGTSYHWKYRAVDSAGGASDWTEFGTVNNTDFTVTNATPTINAATVRQRVYDGSCDANEATVVEQVGAAAAGAILQQTICMNATLVDVNTLPPQELQLQVEVVPMSSTFIGNVTASSLAVKSGTVAKVEVGSLSYGTSYHWKYRAVDSAGGFTGWTEFGTSGNTDFMVVNATPVISLLQRFYDGSCDGNEAGVAVGGVISTSGICLEAAVSDTNTLPTNNIRLEIEVQPVGASFTGTATHYNPSSTTYGAPGVKAIAVNGLTLGGSYHWRARALDDTARSDGISGWVSFGSNSDGSPPTTPADADFTAPCRADGIIGGNGDNVYDATGSGLGGSQTLTVTPGATSSYALSVQNEQITATTFTLSWITPTNWTVSVTDGTTETSNGSYPTGSILPGASAMYTLKATPPLSGAVTEQIIVNIVPTTSACTSGVAASLWHFDEGSGVTTSDGTTNNNTGYLSATNLLLNPSFETPTSGAPTSWTVVIGTGTSSNVDATVQHGGLQSMKLVFNGTSAAFGRQQAVAVTANAQYVLRGWLRNSLTSTNKFLQCDVQGTGIDSSGIRLDVNADWTFATETVLIPVGTTSVNVRCFADGTPAGNGWVDELSFTRVSTMPTWTTGKSGFVNALSFDGVDDYVEVPNAAPLQLTGDLTLEAWVNPTNFAATRWILSKAQPSGNFDAEYRLSITSAGLLNFSHRKSATSQDTISNGASLTPGIWQYVAAVVSGGNVTFYVNEARNGTTQAIVGEPRVATTGSLKIGVSGVTGFMSPFLGSIDEVVIWNRALTLTEIQAHAAATSGLVVNAAMAANPDSVKAVAAIAPTASQIRAPNLTVTNPPDATLSQTQLNLTWVDNSGSANSPPDPETGFKVERLDITGTGVCPGTTTGFTQIKEVLSDTVQSASTGGLVYYPDTGLTPGKKYCYQVRAFVRPVWAASDGSQDINSAYSNQAQAPNPTSGSSDTKAPAAVTDLTIKQGEQRKDSITLTWTAPPDDFDAPGVGSAASYDVRYSMLPIVDGTPGANQVDWSNLACADSTKPVDCVVQATGEPAPQLAGSPETFTVTGLATNTIYYFALKAADERGFPTGQSLMSNVAYCAGTTTSCGDNTTDGSKAGRTALRTNFNLISVPLKPASPNPMVIFEDDISGAPQLFRWNSTGFNADNGSFINYNATYTGYGLSSDAVGVWHLDGGSPTPDSSGYANNGTLVGGPSYGAGKFTSALSLNGATQYVDMGNVLNFNAQSFTVEGWIKTTQGTQWRLVQKRGTGNAGTTAGWQISGASTLNNVVVDNGLSASIYSGVTTNTGANYGVPALSTKVINDGQWHHIAMTWNSTTGQLLVYVDGALEINQTNPSLIGANLTTIRNLTIGAAWDAVGTQSQFLAGTVDEVAIWNRALTSSEIWAHATATGPLTTTTLLIQPGEGYFLIGGPYNPVIDVPVGSRALQAGDVNYGTYCGVANSFAIHLSKGWNMIGNPFTTRKDLTNSKVRIFNNDASCVTYTAAYTNPYPNNWIQNAGAIYELKGANYIYLAPALPDVYSAPQAILEPWKGYFIQAGNGSGDTNTYELIIPGP
ncbi:MAG: hypothetical protein HY204_01525 [Nitrospirae bacterium]|nr:hypothetical protein [Nitrospirota bacterium]